MASKQKIQEDLKTALKAAEQVKASTLRLLLAALVNKEKEKIQKELSEQEIQEVVLTEAKKRREAAESFEKGGRQELAEKEKQELEVLLSYLPEQLKEQEIRQLVREAIQKTRASSMQDMGRVMAELAPQIKGRADGGQVSSMVKEMLSS